MSKLSEMRGVSWLQFFVYAVSLVISLALSLFRPDVKDVLCTGLPVGGLNNGGDRERSNSTSHQQRSEEMIK
jgi:hypothetical protein